MGKSTRGSRDYPATVLPPLSPAAVSRLAMDAADNRLKLSENGGPYLPIGGGGGGTVPTDNALYVMGNGNDATGGPDLTTPFLTIGAALGAAVAGQLVVVYPGTYPESIVVPAGVTLLGYGGPERVLVTGAGGGAHTVQVSDGAYVQGIGATAPAGAGAVTYLGATLAYVYDVMLTGSAAFSAGLLHRGTGKLIASEVRYVAGDFAAVVDMLGTGILALTGLHVPPAGGTIAAAVRGNGGARMQLSDINCGDPGVVDGVQCAAATIVMRASALFNCTNGLHITADTANVQWQSVRFDSTAGFDLLVDPGLTGAGGTCNLTACELQEQKVSIPPGWLASDHNWTFQDARSDIDEASFRCFTDLTVGHAEKGFRLDAGQGCPTSRGMVVITTDATAGPASDGGNLTDVSAAARSKSGSTFTFQGTAAGHAVLFGSSLEDASGVLKTYGAEFATTVARVGGTLIAEVWDGAGWVEVGAAESDALAPHASRGPDLFATTDPVNVRLGIDARVLWIAKSISGQTLFWWRLRATRPMGTAPVWQQSKLHPSCSRVNTDGVTEFFGLARRTLDEGLTLRDTDDLNGLSPNNIDIEFGSLGAFVATADVQDNSFQNNATDGLSLVWPIGPSVDTSLACALRIWWRPSNADVGDVLWRVGYRAVVVGSAMTAAAALDATVDVLGAGPGTTDQLLFTDVPMDIGQASAGGGLLGIAFTRQGSDAADTFTGNAEVVAIQLLASHWRI